MVSAKAARAWASAGADKAPARRCSPGPAERNKPNAPSPARSTGSPGINRATAVGASIISPAPRSPAAGSASIHNANAAGTALGLLPFLAAGQTHQSKGPYKTHITKAVNWLVSHQRPQRRSFGRRSANVLARLGGHRALRGLRHDQRFAHSPCRPGGRAIHPRRAKRAGRLAIHIPTRRIPTSRFTAGR